MKMEMEMEMMHRICEMKKKEVFSQSDVDTMKGFVQYCSLMHSNVTSDDVTKNVLHLLHIYLTKGCYPKQS